MDKKPFSFDIPKVIKPLDFGDYDDQLKGNEVQVWVNFPKAMTLEYSRLSRDASALGEELKKLIKRKRKATEKEIEELQERMGAANLRLYSWFAKILSQHQDEATHITGQEMADKALEFMESDPAFWGWFMNGIWGLINGHRSRNRKN